MIRIQFILLIFILCSVCLISSSPPYDLDVLPSQLQESIRAKADLRDPITNKFIPRNVWIAVRNSSDEPAAHMLGPKGFIARNANWTVHFCGNEEKDAFMYNNFGNSSFLWAYDILNPLIGTAKAELWRLAVLYIHGGMYMDDDANLSTPLDDIVELNDKFIVGKEGYNWTDMCYVDEYLLSNHSLNQRYGQANERILFDNRFFFNWALFAMPGNPLLYRIMTHIVNLIKNEYLGNSLIKLSPSDHRGKLLMCASTFPITLAAREMILEQKGTEIGLRVGSEQFAEYGGDMKAWNNDYNPNRWVKVMQKKRVPYLREYAPPRIDQYEKKLIQAQNSREIFYVEHLKRHSIPNFDTFLAMNFSLDSVHILPPQVVNLIPIGNPLPSK